MYNNKIVSLMTLAYMMGGKETHKMFKVDNDPVVLDLNQIETEYNLIQQKKSALSKKDRAEIVRLWEKRIADGHT